MTSRGSRLSPLNAAEGILSALLGLNFKVKGTCGGGAAGKVDEGDLIEADVHRWLVDIDEAPLQRVQQSRARLVGAGDALGPGVPGGGHKRPSQCLPQQQGAQSQRAHLSGATHVCSGPQVRGPHRATLMEATDTIETRRNQVSKGLCSHPGGFYQGDSAQPSPTGQDPAPALTLGSCLGL